jgi:dihydroceramidase
MPSDSPQEQRGFTLTPGWVLLILSVVLTLTTSIYLSALNSTFQDSKDLHNKPGIYGVMSADFDWCERNHHYSEYIAEPFNTFTSLTYCAVAIFAFTHHRKHGEVRMLVLYSALFIIGIGSTLFHGTLQYEMQLMDELPMLYLILTASWSLFERNDLSGSTGGKVRAAILFVISIACTVLTTCTPKDSQAHTIGRTLMVISFSVCFAYVFYAASTASGEHQEILGKNARNPMSEMFSYGFLCIMVALVSWIIDNMTCDFLYSLPVYPQLHAIGWHFGTAFGVYFMYLAVYIQRLGLRKYKYSLDYVPFLHFIRIPVVKA